MAPHPLIGKKAPTIILSNQNGEEVTVEPGATGTPLAVFFYPESGSFGCTKEACAFRDALKGSEVFHRSKIQIIGISGDEVAKQKKFVDQNGLPYPILSDQAGVARKAYGVKKGLLGMTEGRVTFFITPDGIVKDVYSSVVNFNDHTKFVRKLLESEEKNRKEAKAEETTGTADAVPNPVGGAEGAPTESTTETVGAVNETGATGTGPAGN